MSKSGMASSSSTLQRWCEDGLHSLLGFADSALASYLVHVARRAKSPDEIEAVLREGGVNPASSEAQRSFCRALYQRSRGSGNNSNNNGSRASRGGGGATASVSHTGTTTNSEWVEKAREYELLEEEEDDDDYGDGQRGQPPRRDSSSPPSSRKERQKKEKKKDRQGKDDDHRGKAGEGSKKDRLKEKKKRLRTYEDDDDDDDQDGSDGRGLSNGNDDDGNVTVVKRELTEDRRQRRRDKRQRDDDGGGDGNDDDDDDEGGNQNQQRRHPKGGKKEDALTPEERAALDRERDLRERDEFVQRMLERDQKKTAQMAEHENDGDGDGGDETKEALQRRLHLEERLARGETIVGDDGKELNLERLREESRRSYLKKRQEREVTLLKQSLDDEEELFRNQKLSEAERKRIELGRKIVKMVEKSENRDGQEDDGFYRLPDEYDDKATKGNQDQALLSSRYVEDKREKSEQELWEESQTRKAEITHTKKKSSSQEKKYDLVFEDAIDFVMQETTKGYDKRDEKHRVGHGKTIKEEDEGEAAIKAITEHEKILEGRKKLPVYPYREEFLAAVKDHQILVLVGETGSGKTTQVRHETINASRAVAWLNMRLLFIMKPSF